MKQSSGWKHPFQFLIAGIIALLLLGSASVFCVHAETNPQTLNVGIPVDRCPVFYLDQKTNEPVGIGVELMQEAAEKAGFTVVFCPLEEPSLKDALDNEKYDVVMPFGSAVHSTAGRKTIVSDNLIETPFTLVTKNKRKIKDLQKLRIGMLSSLKAGAETVGQRYPGIEIRFFDTMPECVNALRAGAVDGLLHNSYVWSCVLQKPSYSDLSVQPSAMFSMDFRAATPDTPKGRAIIEQLNRGIATLTDTRRQAIVLDYTTRQLYQYDFWDYLRQYAWIVVIVIVLFVFFVIYNRKKRRELLAQHEQKLQQVRDRDELTGLLTLNAFRKRVEELAHAHPDHLYFLSYNNVNNFKFINDSFGREEGDAFLKFWAERSMATLSDDEAICRIDADHFAVLRHIQGDEKIREDEELVFRPLRNYFIDRGKENRVQMSSGIYVLTPGDFQNPDVDRMLDFARIAERKVREAHKDGFEFYNPMEWEKGKRIVDIVGHLPSAIRDGEIYIWYQPQVEYETGKIIGIEALCRWNHPKLGWISPSEFIPILEETKLIYELDYYVWDKVCQDLQRWEKQGYHRVASVNVSRSDIDEVQNIPGQFFQLVQKYGLSPDQLRIEITETAYTENPERLIRTTVKFREFGFQVEMDDFGSGYSSLHMLKEVPVDRIKLDFHFLTGVGDPERGRIIISHIIQMTHSLGMQLIAEGVENAAQAEFLSSQGCSEMQGFYFYEPMTVGELEKLTEKE